MFYSSTLPLTTLKTANYTATSREKTVESKRQRNLNRHAVEREKKTNYKFLH